MTTNDSIEIQILALIKTSLYSGTIHKLIQDKDTDYSVEINFEIRKVYKKN